MSPPPMAPRTGAPTATPTHGPGPAPLPGPLALAAIPAFGHLCWVAWWWLGAAGLLVASMVVGGVTGEVGESHWQGITGLLGWVVLAAGVTTVPCYGPTFVANGTTRGRLASSSVLALGLVCVLGGLVAVAGYAVEALVYGSQGWPQDLRGGGSVDGVATVAGLGLGHVALLTCYAATGWLVGVAWLRLGWVAFVASLVPAAVPALAAEVLVPSTVGVAVGWWHPPLAIGVVAALAVAAVAAAVAARLTREVPFEP